MYLTRLILNPRSRRVQREIAEPYEMHRTILRAFPETLDPDERVLFRLDTHSETGAPLLLVQSLGFPDWSFLDESGGYSYLFSEDNNPAVKAFSPKFHPGQQLLFRLTANPTVKKDGRRLGLYKIEDQLAWLQRKALSAGFLVATANLTKRGSLKGTIHRTDEKHSLNLLQVQFDGLLRVSEPQALLEAVQNGIGSGKGFGCGLLSLAPAS